MTKFAFPILRTVEKIPTAVAHANLARGKKTKFS